MKCLLHKTERGLRGSTPQDHEHWERFKRRLKVMKPGQCMRFEWSSPRNPQHHRLLFALIQLITENSEAYRTTEQALVAIKLAAGYFEPVVDPRTGHVVPVPQSISFEKMGQEDFERFYSAALDGVIQVILPQLGRGDVDELLSMIVEGWA